MKYFVVKRIAALSFALSLAAPGFAQGLYWQSKTTGMGGEHVSDTYAVPKKMKVSQTGRDQSVTIFRLDKEVMWQLDPEKKTYSEMTFAQLENAARAVGGQTDAAGAAGGRMDAAQKKMEEEMKNMSDEERKMVEKMMGSRMPGAAGKKSAPVEVTNTGEDKKISGFACTKFTAKQGENILMTVWVTRDVRGFDELREDWKAFAKRMAAMAPQGSSIADAYKKIDGFPIQTEMLNRTTTVTKVERRPTPASEFEIPSGYTKVRSQMEEAMEKMDREKD